MKKGMKRFYRSVDLAEGVEGFQVRLDGRPIRTPAKALVLLPFRALAESLVSEWKAQSDRIDPETMSMTRICCTALDQVRPNRERILSDLVGYGGHDLLCYRCNEPPDLAAAQQRLWQPLLDWAALNLDARLNVTTSLVSVSQPEDTLAALARAIGTYDDFALAALGQAVTASGSLVVGLALAHRRLDAAGAFEVSQLEESYQIQRWGEDAELTRRRAGILQDLQSAEAFFRLAGA